MTERILSCAITYRNIFLAFAILCAVCLVLQYRFNYESIARCFSKKGYVATRVVERVYFELPASSPTPGLNTLHFTTRQPLSSIPTTTHETSTEQPRCQPQNYVVFLKTHKTGSSTITNILNRFADWNNLTMLLPREKQFYSFNWPNKFRLSYAKDTHGRMPNILGNHARYSRKSMHLLFPPAKTAYITILREPVKQWESMFSYMSFPYILNIHKMKDPLDFFLKHPPSFQNLKKNARRFPSINLIRNPLFFDLGLDYRYHGNITFMRRAIKTIDKDFDLVLMMEHFDESMVLLKRRLCWSMDDIVFFKTNERLNKNKRRGLTAEQENLIKLWNSADIALYNYFVEKFWKEIEKEGPDFYDDLQTLKERKMYYFNACIEKEAVTEAYNSVFVKGYEMRKNLTGDMKLSCERMLRNELTYQDYFKEQYANRVDKLEGETIENFDDQVEEADVDIELGSSWGDEGTSYKYGLPPKRAPKLPTPRVNKKKIDKAESKTETERGTTGLKGGRVIELKIGPKTPVFDDESRSDLNKKTEKYKLKPKLRNKPSPTSATKKDFLASTIAPANPITLEGSKLTTLAKHMNELENPAATKSLKNMAESMSVSTKPSTQFEIERRDGRSTSASLENKKFRKLVASRAITIPPARYIHFRDTTEKEVHVETANKMLKIDDPKRYDGKSIIKSDRQLILKNKNGTGKS